jgi:hypothetical protein
LREKVKYIWTEAEMDLGLQEVSRIWPASRSLKGAELKMLEAIVLLSVVPRLVGLVTCYTIGGLTHILLAIAWPSVGLLPPRRISFFSLL